MTSKKLIKYLVFDTNRENLGDPTLKVLSPIYVEAFIPQMARALIKTGLINRYKNSMTVYLYLEGASDEDILKYGKNIAYYSWNDSKFKPTNVWNEYYG